MPAMRPVDSSSIDEVGYDAGKRELYVRFLESGDTYVYYGVEREVYDDLLAAPSKGAYLNRAIKGRYFYRKLS
jgi:hypothetical protein